MSEWEQWLFNKDNKAPTSGNIVIYIVLTKYLATKCVSLPQPVGPDRTQRTKDLRDSCEPKRLLEETISPLFKSAGISSEDRIDRDDELCDLCEKKVRGKSAPLPCELMHISGYQILSTRGFVKDHRK